jgi:hypothetical protein
VSVAHRISAPHTQHRTSLYRTTSRDEKTNNHQGTKPLDMSQQMSLATCQSIAVRCVGQVSTFTRSQARCKLPGRTGLSITKLLLMVQTQGLADTSTAVWSDSNQIPMKRIRFGPRSFHNGCAKPNQANQGWLDWSKAWDLVTRVESTNFKSTSAASIGTFCKPRLRLLGWCDVSFTPSPGVV